MSDRTRVDGEFHIALQSLLKKLDFCESAGIRYRVSLYSDGISSGQYDARFGGTRFTPQSASDTARDSVAAIDTN
jgi:hypothetical protein